MCIIRAIYKYLFFFGPVEGPVRGRFWLSTLLNMFIKAIPCNHPLATNSILSNHGLNKRSREKKNYIIRGTFH